IGRRNGGIRNLSMKKFGTPMAAGPGDAIEAVGFVGAGMPLDRVSGRVGTGVVAGRFWRATGPAFLHPLVEVEVLPSWTHRLARVVCLARSCRRVVRRC